jgi:hypothetical protein
LDRNPARSTVDFLLEPGLKMFNNDGFPAASDDLELRIEDLRDALFCFRVEPPFCSLRFLLWPTVSLAGSVQDTSNIAIFAPEPWIFRRASAATRKTFPARTNYDDLPPTLQTWPSHGPFLFGATTTFKNMTWHIRSYECKAIPFPQRVRGNVRRLPILVLLCVVGSG